MKGETRGQRADVSCPAYGRCGRTTRRDRDQEGTMLQVHPLGAHGGRHWRCRGLSLVDLELLLCIYSIERAHTCGYHDVFAMTNDTGHQERVRNWVSGLGTNLFEALGVIFTTADHVSRS